VLRHRSHSARVAAAATRVAAAATGTAAAGATGRR
jgi:hypothetical protein